ncbi:MAG: hypothetical protein KBG15_11945 [Kofleriaceae bacterium]|nr:hypothetical protein [Kofleriaceae bacterium]
MKTARLLPGALALMLLGATATTANAQPSRKTAAAKRLPPAPPMALAVGQPWNAGTLPQWLGDPPVANDAAGKVTLHWFCNARVATCKDDLARVLHLREAGKIYVIAYIDGAKRDAGKLDPVRDAVGAGAVAFGPKVTKLMGFYGMGKGPSAIVVDVDGNVVLISNGGEPEKLDARDKKVNDLVAAIKDFSVTSGGPKASVKTGERFTLSVQVELAAWLTFNRQAITEFALTVSPDFKCDTLALKGDKVTIDGRKLTASIGCVVNGKGSYEARGNFRFGYDSPNGSTALGTDSVGWKFDVVAESK